MPRFALKYLLFRLKSEKLQKKFKLRYRACQVLCAATLAHLEDKPFRVLDLMKREDIASPATIHALLKELREKGLLVVEENPIDGRIKHLIPTAQAMKLFSDIGKEMNGNSN